MRTPIRSLLALDVLLLLFLLAACAGPAKIADRTAVTDEAEGRSPVPAPTSVTAFPDPTAASTPVPSDLEPRPATAYSTPRTQYALTVDLDYARHHLAVSEVITYPNQTGDSLRELQLDVEPNRLPGAFHLKQLNWSDGRPVDDYSLREAFLRITLPSALPPGAALCLALSYSLDLPAKAASFGYSSGQISLADWYPFVLPYDPGTGWLKHEPAAVGEHLAYDQADFQVDLQLVGSLQQLVIAAPAPSVSQGTGYHYRLEQARTFALAIGERLQSASRRAGAVTVVSYYLPEHAAAARAALAATAQALVLYSRLFAPYPRSRLTLVEANFADGLEEDGFFFLGPEYYAGYQADPKGYLTAIAVHETAHQWWFARVGNDQADEPWLDEALATYSELLYYENNYPALADWWWNWRINRFAPAGPVDGRIYDYPAFRPYVNAVYFRGTQFLQRLRVEIGDSSFFAFLHDYAARMSDKQATTSDFFAILRSHTSVDLDPLEAGYFQHPH